MKNYREKILTAKVVVYSNVLVLLIVSLQLILLSLSCGIFLFFFHII